MHRYLVTTLALLITALSAHAAPPTLTSLYPAGGQRGTTVTVTATGTFTPWPVKAWCDSPKITVTAAKESGKLSVASADDVIPGTYWIRLFNDEGASELRPFLVSNLPEVLEQEPNDEFRKPHALTTSTVLVNGRLDKKTGDVDCYALKLKKGQTLVAALEAFDTLRSPMDGVLQILSADGFVLEQNNDFHDMDPQITFPVPKDGDYVVRVFAFPAKPDTAIRFSGGDNFIYRLTLTTGGFADHAFPLAVRTGDKSPVALVGWNVPDAARAVQPVPLTGQFAAAFHPLLANAALVRLESHAAVTCKERTSREKPLVVSLPTTISGKLEKPGAFDVFQFDVKKGQKLVFEIESRSLGFPLDPVLRLTDAKGKVLAEPKGTKLNTDPQLLFTVPADGSYRLEVHDFHGDGGPRFVYRLRLVPAEPDFALSLASDRLTLAPGKPLDVPITLDKRHGFTQEVEFHLEGLPPGLEVKIEAPKAAAKGAALKLTAKGGPASVPVRLIGRTKDGITRTARATGADPSWTSEHLWLTVNGMKK